MSSASPDHLTGLIGPTVHALGLDLDALELTTAGRRRVLRVVVDKDGGVSLDDIADATRAVSKELDADDVLGEQPYTLEVTSRGVDRPLTSPRNWVRNIGRLVEVALVDGTVVTGRVTGADDTGADLAVPAATSRGGHRASDRADDPTPHRVPYTEVRRALVQVEFARKEG
jgi:ribosome maturation factor RimP